MVSLRQADRQLVWWGEYYPHHARLLSDLELIYKDIMLKDNPAATMNERYYLNFPLQATVHVIVVNFFWSQMLRKAMGLTKILGPEIISPWSLDCMPLAATTPAKDLRYKRRRCILVIRCSSISTVHPRCSPCSTYMHHVNTCYAQRHEFVSLFNLVHARTTTSIIPLFLTPKPAGCTRGTIVLVPKTTE
jgi:hypothetical protein